MESHPTQNWQDHKHLFFAHISGLRSNSWTQNAYITMFAERNTGHESGHLAEVLSRFPQTAAYMQPSKADAQKIRDRGVVVRDDVMSKYMEEAQKNPGFFTDSVLKNSFRTAARMMLSRDAVFYLDGCVCTNPFLHDKDRREKFLYAKATLEEQLSRARVFSRRPTYDTSAPKVMWSGKVDDDGVIQTGYNDDLAVIMASGLYFWPLAMGCALPGFPYDDVGMAGVDESYAGGRASSSVLV